MTKEEWIEEHKRQSGILGFPNELIKSQFGVLANNLRAMENFRNGYSPYESVREIMSGCLHSYAEIKNADMTTYGTVVVTKNSKEECVLLSVQDEDHKILKVIWEKK